MSKKRILLSLSIIVAVGAIVIGATISQFSDDENSENNTFTAGTIDIAIDGTNPWTGGPYRIGDLKPGETGYINFDIKNVGQNPVDISKSLKNFEESTGIVSEPECTSQGGTWANPAGGCTWNGDDENNIQNMIVYDLSVDVYSDEEKQNLIWWQDIYTDAEGKKLSEVYPDDNTFVELGMIPVGGHMLVKQSYHFDYNAGNEYQGDLLTFDMTVKGEQLTGANGYASVVLENKSDGPNWDILQFDAVKGTLNYQNAGNEFNYNFTATVNTPDIGYTLLYVGSSGNYPYVNEEVIGTGTASGNSLSLDGNPDLGVDIVNGKVWLVPSTAYPSGWDHANNLYETGLINYDDTNN